MVCHFVRRSVTLGELSEDVHLVKVTLREMSRGWKMVIARISIRPVALIHIQSHCGLHDVSALVVMMYCSLHCCVTAKRLQV